MFAVLDFVKDMKRTLIAHLVLTFAVLMLEPANLGAADELSEAARAQIQALQAEKAARTGALLKMDSRLIYGLNRSRNQAVAGAPQLRTGVQTMADGRVLVDITATVTPALLDFISSLGGQVVGSFPQFRAIRAQVPLNQIESLAARAEVAVIKPAVKAMTNAGLVTSEGDITHRAALARQVFGVTGAGVKVGVLSDSVDFLANSQVTGDLPTNVIVLPGQSGVPGSGEGTAMLEIVHDLAPGAQLYFASGFNGAAQFAQNILDLRAAGCDVIIDDIFYFDESPFQDAIIAQAVNAVTASGALYFSSAGNEGNLKHGTSGTWEGDFADGGAITISGPGAKSGRIHTFGPSVFNTVTSPGFAAQIFWSDPLGASTNDYDLYVIDATGNNIVDASTIVQNGAQDPYEIVNPPFPGERIAIVKYSGEARFLHLETLRGTVSIGTGGKVTGHACATNAFAVAAIDVASAFPNAFVAGTNVAVEDFSSDGPRRVFYHQDGTPINPTNFLSTGGAVRSKPDITAADGVVTTLPPTSGLNPFFGTSAAAPHAGAIAALIKSYNPLLPLAQIINILTNTALDIENPGWDINSGLGTVMAYQAILATPPPSLTLVSRTVIDGNRNGVIDPNECDDMHVVIRNDTATNFSAGLALLFTTTPGVTIVQPSFAFPTLLRGQYFTNQVPFKFTVASDFNCGAFIDFGLVISNQNRLRTNLFQIPTGLINLTPALVNNSGPVIIPDGNTNGVDSLVTVSGLAGGIGKVTVSVHATHPAASELTLQLVGPDGTVVNLSRNRGFAGADYGLACSPLSVRTTFDDNSPNSIVLGTSPFAGFFRPEEPLSRFAGKYGASLNGSWRLRVVDPVAGNAGAIECWTLGLYPSICTDGGGTCIPDVAVVPTGSPSPALVSSNLVYAVTVTNRGPVSATAVVLTNLLPANSVFVSAGASQGACSLNAGTVTCNLGTLPGGSAAVVSIAVQPIAVGSVVAVFGAGASSADVNLSNNVATLVSSVVEAAPVFVSAGAFLTLESGEPATGGIESGETVTVNFSLRNSGQLASDNLVATLLEGNGVFAPSPAQTYGAIAPGAAGTQAFSFTAPGAPGSAIDAVLQLQDGVRNLGTVAFHFTVGGAVTFENAAPIVINQFGTSSPYPSTISVVGLEGTLAGVQATLTKLSHSFPDDIDALLVNPQGQKVILMSDAGGNVSITNRTLTFADSAAAFLPNETGLVAGSYRPSNFDSGTEPGGDIFPPPAPAGALSSSLGAFVGTDPNGTWSLFMHDDGGGDAGAVNGGWSLALSMVYPVNPLANLTVGAVAAPASPVLGEPLTFSISVTNLGPSNAPAVVVSDVIPDGTSFLSASASQGGSVNFAAGVVTADLGAITNGGTATVTIQVVPNALGAITNTATVGGAVSDLVSVNNTARTVMAVGNPVGDMGISVAASTMPVFLSSNLVFTVVVTNKGPNRAPNVAVGSYMASVLNVSSAVPSQGGCLLADGTVLCHLGDLLPNSSAVITIAAVGGAVGSSNATFAVSTDATDPVAANNSTNVSCAVIPRAPVIVASGSALVGENFAPANGAIESGEIVTFSFGLRNVGTEDTADLVATLLSTGGVSSPSAPQQYGLVYANAQTASRAFSFVVSGAPGSVLTATLHLQDGVRDLGNVSFTCTISSSRSFTNGNVIVIPNQGKATNYPSTINVSGITGSVSKVTVDIRRLVHSFPEDIDMLLVGPGGQKVLLMSDAGAGNAVSDVNLTFDDGAGTLPFSATIASGSYRGTDYPPGDSLPSPAPAGPYGTNLSAFNGTDPNGTWSLYVFDDAAGDAGRIDGGWSVNVQTATPVVSSADLAVSISAPAAADSGVPFTYTIYVANYGPAAATGVTVTDALPPSFVVSGVTVPQGTYTTGSGTVTANLGVIPVGSLISLTVTGAGVGPQDLVNLVSVSATQSDANPINNVASVTTTLGLPALTIRRSGATVVISWLAPSTGYVLQSASSINGPFAPAGFVVTTANGTNQVTVPSSGSTFYRLAKP